MFNIVLLEPEIPANTGNIGRTCLVTGSRLHLIEPMGFIINDKNLKRAGMDYWYDLDVTVYDSWEDFLKKNPFFYQHFPEQKAEEETEPAGMPRLWMATTKARKTYPLADFKDGDYIMFGKESAGIPEEILLEDKEHAIRIPMAHDMRSLNLSNSVAVILYEALRQNDFKDMELEGQLHHNIW